MKKYGVDHPWKDPVIHKEAMIKGYEAKKRNKTFNSSKPEEVVYELLKEKFFNTIRQYSNIYYPFSCDFYIPEKDLFIECNFNWTHGKKAFDENNSLDSNKLKFWDKEKEAHPFYKQAIKTWTVRDVQKRLTAQKNNLNYIEWFSLEEAKKSLKSTF